MASRQQNFLSGGARPRRAADSRAGQFRTTEVHEPARPQPHVCSVRYMDVCTYMLGLVDASCMCSSARQADSPSWCSRAPAALQTAKRLRWWLGLVQDQIADTAFIDISARVCQRAQHPLVSGHAAAWHCCMPADCRKRSLCAVERTCMFVYRHQHVITNLSDSWALPKQCFCTQTSQIWPWSTSATGG